MALLKSISPEEATGDVALIYQNMMEKVNFIPNVIKMYTASPEFLGKFMGVVGHFSDHPTLDTVLVSYIRLLISNKEGGTYCVRLQSAILSKYEVDTDDINKACANYTNINLDTKRKDLVCFVLDMMYDKLSKTKERIVHLTNKGWTEKDIYEACMLGAIQKGAVHVIKGFEVENDF